MNLSISSDSTHRAEHHNQGCALASASSAAHYRSRVRKHWPSQSSHVAAASQRLPIHEFPVTISATRSISCTLWWCERDGPRPAALLTRCAASMLHQASSKQCNCPNDDKSCGCSSSSSSLAQITQFSSHSMLPGCCTFLLHSKVPQS